MLGFWFQSLVVVLFVFDLCYVSAFGLEMEDGNYFFWVLPDEIQRDILGFKEY